MYVNHFQCVLFYTANILAAVFKVITHNKSIN